MKKLSFMLVVLLVIQWTACVYAAGKDANDFESAVSDLMGEKILSADFNKSAEDTVTRAEAAAMLVRAYGLNEDIVDAEYSGDTPFEDTANHWAAKFVSMAKKLEITNGTSPTTFSPDRSITIQEFVKMTVSLMGYSEMAKQRGDYPHGYMQTASTIGVMEGMSVTTNDEATTEDVVKILANAMDIPLMMQTGFGSVVEYAVMDGRNGFDLITLRTRIHE